MRYNFAITNVPIPTNACAIEERKRYNAYKISNPGQAVDLGQNLKRQYRWRALMYPFHMLYLLARTAHLYLLGDP